MLPDIYTRNRYGVLFFGLLLSLVLSPVLDPLGLETGLVEVLLAMNLVAAAVALDRGPVRRTVLVVLAIALVTRPAADLMQYGDVSIASLVVWGVLALGTVAAALRFALGNGLQLIGYSHLLLTAPFGRLEHYLPSGPGLF